MEDFNSGGPKEDLVHLPLVPLRDIVVFPGTLLPFIVGREGSLRAFSVALDGDKRLFLATQRDATEDEPAMEGLNSIGTVATIVQHQRLPNGNIKVLVEGVALVLPKIETSLYTFGRATLSFMVIKQSPKKCAMITGNWGNFLAMVSRNSGLL